MKNSTQAKGRIYYVDNLRIFLTALVVLHHFAITYGAPGGWFYNESVADIPESIPFSMFVATNQAFFMGMFFFVSAFFISASLKKKGMRLFSRDRLIRLGIPTALFFFILYPLTVFIRNKFIRGEEVTLLDYIFGSKVFGFGPMWFVEALLIFTFVYLLWRLLRKGAESSASIPAPNTWQIILFAGLIGLGQFIIRIWLPVGWSMPFTNFQFPHFLQYIFLFVFGIVAYEQKWLDAVTPKMGWRWFGFVQAMIFIAFPLLFVLGGAPENGADAFMGGLSWQNFAYAMWEQLVGIGMIVGLLGIFKSRFNEQGSLAKKLSASAYGVYVFHPPLIVLISALFLDFDIPQLLKFVVLAPVALIVCFGVGFLLKKLPLTRSIF